MLQRLHIKNYAIIDEVELIFSKNFSIITGETGAGKSILMGALGLILGDRADSSSLLQKDKKSFVEGFFSIRDLPEAMAFLEENDLANDSDELILRRDISPQGKSRAFINDYPVTLQQLKNLAVCLVDLHRQFDILDIADTDFQRNVLDALAGNEAALTLYRKQFVAWQTARKTYDGFIEQKENAAKELDYHQYLFAELQALSFEPQEVETLETELQLLNNAESIKELLHGSYQQIEGDEQAILPALRQMIQGFRRVANGEKNLTAIWQRLESLAMEWKDLAREIEHCNDKIQYDPARIEWINDRISAGYKLFKKHGVQTTDELLAVQESLEEKCRAVITLDEQINKWAAEETAARQAATEMAEKISAARRKQIGPFEKNVSALLGRVGMANATLQVVLHKTPLQESGMDTVEFLFDANKTGRPEPLKKVASGGELSRLMLCIKSLVAAHMTLPTLIFDEIDTGISGEAARQAGNLMKQLASTKQVIAITHQPQIAGQADTHYLVYKEEIGQQLKTKVRILSEQERIEVIAKMLSGDKPSAAARENAREMVKSS